ncbi:MAG TPA: MerR family transcriptional regulator, partial [Rhizobiales bacterium]|nr:MerR family transcriptional regulator [Hyphomicrobiales bacterium]
MMMTVSELSRSAQVTPDAVRHYVRIGLLKPSRDPANGYKLFSSGDIRRVKFIRQAKGLGFSLNDIREIFRHESRGQSPCPVVRDIIRHRIDDNRARLAELNALQRRME